MSIIQVSIFVGLLQIASASGNDLSELKTRISSFEDPKITVQDLAFYLVTHNYDAAPGDGCVELRMNDMKYRLIPNGNKPGLCEISPDGEPQR